MMKTFGEWALDNYKEHAIMEDEWIKQDDRYQPGKAWGHMYSARDNISYVLPYDVYKEASNNYDEYRHFCEKEAARRMNDI